MNNKGNVSLMALVVLGVISLYLSIMLYSSAGLKIFVRNHEEILVEEHHYKTALTRAISCFKKDILESGPFIFNDIEQNIDFEEISKTEEETVINKTAFEEHEVVFFDVLMDTTINIDFYSGEFGRIILYSPDDEVIIDSIGGSWAVSSSRWGHGEYTLMIIDGSADVYFTQVVERVIRLDSYVLRVELSRGQNEVYLEK